MSPESPLTQGEDHPWLALYQALTVLGGSLDPQRVLATALEESGEVIASLGGNPEHLVGALLLFREDRIQPRTLQVSAMRGLSPEDCAIQLSGTAGLIGQVIQEGEARLAQEIESDPELARFAALRACQEAYCVPLGKPSAEGVLLYGHPEAGFFTRERRHVLLLLAGYTWLALSNARRFRESQLKLERIQDLQELNRAELGRELHDGPVQSLAALAMRAGLARRMAAREAPDMVEELEKIEAIARQATGDLRKLLFRLHPQLLESRGLGAALQELAEKTSQVHGIQVRVRVEPEVLARLDMGKQAAIFELVDQALREACKKEALENIWVRLASGGQAQIYLEVEDDGLAVADWNPGGAQPAGMQVIQKTVAHLEGGLEFVARENRGSCLRIAFPLDEIATGAAPDKA